METHMYYSLQIVGCHSTRLASQDADVSAGASSGIAGASSGLAGASSGLAGADEQAVELDGASKRPRTVPSHHFTYKPNGNHIVHGNVVFSCILKQISWSFGRNYWQLPIGLQHVLCTRVTRVHDGDKAIEISPGLTDHIHLNDDPAETYMKARPLRTSFYEVFSKMPSSVRREMVNGISEFVKQFGDEVPFGTGFSGCDVVTQVLDELCKFLNEVVDVKVTFIHKWACESNDCPLNHKHQQLGIHRGIECLTCLFDPITKS